MNKNLSKIVAVGIGLSIFTGSIVPVVAAETINTQTMNNVQALAAENKVLTVEEAVNATIANSATLALKSKEIKLYQDKFDIQDDMDDFLHEDHGFAYDSLELLISQNKEQMEFLEDQIAYDITKKFNNLVTTQIQIDKLKKDIEIKNKEIANKQLKYNVGLATSIEIEGAKLELQNLQISLTAKEKSLKDNTDYLALLTNLNLSKYTLDKGVEFKPFRIEGSVDSYMSQRVEDYLHYSDELIKLNKDNLKDNKVTKPSAPSNRVPSRNDFYSQITNVDGTVETVFDEDAYTNAMTEYTHNSTVYLNKLTEYIKYLGNKYSSSESEVNLAESKRTLKKGLIDSYTALSGLEDNINLLKSQMELTNKTLEITRAQYNVGLATKLDYDKAVVKSEETEITLKGVIDQYNTLKESIEKPWVLSSKTL